MADRGRSWESHEVWQIELCDTVNIFWCSREEQQSRVRHSRTPPKKHICLKRYGMGNFCILAFLLAAVSRAGFHQLIAKIRETLTWKHFAHITIKFAIIRISGNLNFIVRILLGHKVQEHKKENIKLCFGKASGIHEKRSFLSDMLSFYALCSCCM